MRFYEHPCATRALIPPKPHFHGAWLSLQFILKADQDEPMLLAEAPPLSSAGHAIMFGESNYNIFIMHGGSTNSFVLAFSAAGELLHLACTGYQNLLRRSAGAVFVPTTPRCVHWGQAIEPRLELSLALISSAIPQWAPFVSKNPRCKHRGLTAAEHWQHLLTLVHQNSSAPSALGVSCQTSNFKIIIS